MNFCDNPVQSESEKHYIFRPVSYNQWVMKYFISLSISLFIGKFRWNEEQISGKWSLKENVARKVYSVCVFWLRNLYVISLSGLNCIRRDENSTSKTGLSCIPSFNRTDRRCLHGRRWNVNLGGEGGGSAYSYFGVLPTDFFCNIIVINFLDTDWLTSFNNWAN